MSLQTDINKIKAFFTPTESNEAKALAYVDNPDSVFDNLARYVRFAIWLLLIPSAYIGINYHIKLFQKNGMGEMGANVGSFIFFIAIEIFCCFYATCGNLHLAFLKWHKVCISISSPSLSTGTYVVGGKVGVSDNSPCFW